MHIEQIDPEMIASNVEGSLGAANVATQVGGGGDSPIMELAQIELYHVELNVFWGGRQRERSAHFTTLRTTMPDPNGGGSLIGRGNSGGSLSTGSSGSRSSSSGSSSGRRGGN
jgi:hypothetical protein